MMCLAALLSQCIAIASAAFVLSAMAATPNAPTNGSSARAIASSAPTAVGIDAINSRLVAIDNALVKSAEKADEATRRSANYALATVGITSFMTLVVQGLFIWHQRWIETNKSKNEITNANVQWKLKQLSELYGPLRALLGQSNVMYRHMNKALVAADPERFRLRELDKTDFDNLIFEVFINGAWAQFRTVQHLGLVYKKDYDVESHFQSVVDTGRRMVTLIQEKAGYARHDQPDMVHVMGEYLAHFAVLERIYQMAIDGEELHKGNQADKQATFPLTIQKLVNEGCDRINTEIMSWTARSSMPSTAAPTART